MKKIRLTVFVILIVFSLTINSLAQIVLGDITMNSMPAKELTSPLNMKRESIYTQKVLSGVGGVAFERQAHPVNGLEVDTLYLKYDPGRNNGSRLVIYLNNEIKYSKIYDWMLIPIAHYADSPYYGCFTYFGHLIDQNKENEILEKNGKIINYHPAFVNTLLGLRLMQLDLMLMYNDCADLPKKNGEYILGAGETHPDYYKNAKGFNNTLSKLQKIESDLQERFRSYLICDYNQKIKFNFTRDTLCISGNPFFYCWRYRYDNMSQEEQKMYQSELLVKTHDEINEFKKKHPNWQHSIRDWYIDNILNEIQKYEDGYLLYSSVFHPGTDNMYANYFTV